MEAYWPFLRLSELMDAVLVLAEQFEELASICQRD